MTKKIFHSILLVAGTVLLASLLVIMGCLYEYFGSVEKKQLRDELELAAVAVKENGTEYLSQLSSERYRLTWSENDGTVLYDTVTDAESLENHADRVEVKQALEYGEGESTRYSSTLLQKTMYCAERLADGSVLRISMSRATAGVLLVGMGQPILVVLIVALILSSVLAKSLSHRIVQPLNKLDLEHPLEMTPMKSSPRCSGASTASTCRSTSRWTNFSASRRNFRRSQAACAKGLCCSMKKSMC